MSDPIKLITVIYAVNDSTHTDRWHSAEVSAQNDAGTVLLLFPRGDGELLHSTQRAPLFYGTNHHQASYHPAFRVTVQDVRE